MDTVIVLSLTAAPVDAVVEALEDAGQVITAIDAHAASAERCAWAQIRYGGHAIELDQLRTLLHAVADHNDCDVVVLAQPPRVPKLAIFDLDGTLLQCEGIDELARAAQCFEQVAAVTASAMRGELDFAQSFRQRVGCLAGLSETAMSEIAARLPFTPGLDILTQSLRAAGCRLVIASGGFVPFAQAVADRFGFDAVYANTLEVVDDRLSGRHVGAIVDAQAKADILRREAAAYGIDLADTIAVGDGANDLKMLAAAGLGIAFHAKPLVREQSGVGLQRTWLDGVLPLLGIAD